jgi:hypothetical protein
MLDALSLLSMGLQVNFTGVKSGLTFFGVPDHAVTPAAKKSSNGIPLAPSGGVFLRVVVINPSVAGLPDNQSDGITATRTKTALLREHTLYIRWRQIIQPAKTPGILLRPDFRPVFLPVLPRDLAFTLMAA